MDLDQKYELGEVVANDAESKTFRAREGATGRSVLVHLLFGGKGPAGQEPLLNALLERMVDASAERRKQILEISDYKGMPFAVTEPLPGFRTLRMWLEQERGAQPEAPTDPMTRAGKWKIPTAAGADQTAPRPVEEPQAKPLPAQEEDEFARLFGPGSASKGGADTSPAAASAPPPARSPGEFTRLFRATLGDEPRAPIAAAPPPAVEPAAPQPAAPQPPAQPGPGEFTRMFHQPATGSIPPGGASLPEPGPAAAPGEFTRLFHANPPAESVPSGPAGSSPAAGASGEFSKWFESSQAPPAAEPAATPAAGAGTSSGEFTRLFGTPGAGGGSPQSSGPTPPAAPSGATGVFAGARPAAPAAAGGGAEPAGPGEYTRMFGSPSVAANKPPEPMPQPRPAAPAPAAPAPGRQASRLPLIVILSFVVMLTLLVIVYFALR